MIVVRSFGDRILLGDYQVHSRFAKAVNFIQDDRLICLVDPQIGGGPINIVVSALDFTQTFSLHVDKDWFSCGETILPKRPLYLSGFPAGSIDPAGLQRGLNQLEKRLKNTHPKSLSFLIAPRNNFSSAFDQAFAARISNGLRELRRGNLEAGASVLRGSGFGLTPSGDDFLAGWLWGLHAAQKFFNTDLSAEIERIFSSAKSSNPLSAAFLRCAREGRCFEPLQNLLKALMRGDNAQLDLAITQLLASGETSGADTAVGFLMSLKKEEQVLCL